MLSQFFTLVTCARKCRSTCSNLAAAGLRANATVDHRRSTPGMTRISCPLFARILSAGTCFRLLGDAVEPLTIRVIPRKLPLDAALENAPIRIRVPRAHVQLLRAFFAGGSDYATAPLNSGHMREDAPAWRCANGADQTAWPSRNVVLNGQLSHACCDSTRFAQILLSHQLSEGSPHW